MSLQKLIEQLLLLKDEDKQLRFLRARIPQLDKNEIKTVANTLKERVIQYLRASNEDALRISELILLLSKVTLDPNHLALGLRMKAQTLAIGFGFFEQALPYYDEAIHIHQELGDELGEAIIEITRIWSIAHVNEYELAVQAGEKARVVLKENSKLRELATLNGNLAMIHHLFGENIEALVLLNEACKMYSELGEDARQFLTSNAINRAVVLSELGDYQTAIRVFEQAQELAAEFDQTTLTARIQHNLGLTYQYLGNYNQALQLFENARDVWLAEGHHESRIQVELAAISCLLQLRRFKEVLAKCRQVRELQAALDFSLDTAYIFLHEAQAHAEQRNFEDALRSVGKARQRLEGSGSRFWVTQTDLIKADLLYRQGAYDKSEAIAKECAASFSQIEHPLAETQAYLIAARAAMAQQKIGKVLQIVNTALEMATPRDISHSIYQAQHLLGQVAQIQDKLPAALSHFEQAIHQLDRLQSQTMVEFRPDFLEDLDKQRLYENTVAVCLELNQPHNALTFIEKSKSRTLMELLTCRVDLRIEARASHDEALVAALNQLKAKRNLLHRRMTREMHGRFPQDDDDNIEKLSTVEQQITESWHQLLIRNNDYEFDAMLTPKQTASVQQFLDDHTLLIEFFVAQDEIIAFLISGARHSANNTAQVFRLPAKTTAINNLMLAFQNSCDLVSYNIQSGNHDKIAQLIPQAKHALHQLYSSLFAPFADTLRSFSNLIIVPYGFLHYLPFHALYDGQAYLLERHEISYLPGSSFLQHLSDKRPSPSNNVLAVGYSCNGRLPHALQEAQQVADVWSGKSLLEEHASLKNLHAHAANSRLLHFATHGEFREDNPLFSGLTLADGSLTTIDIFNLRLQASLVTLSACHTGRNVIGGGDELLGLMRAFFAVGAASLLLTQWAVADDSTAQLMTMFYRHLTDGKTKTTALQKAQLTLLNGSDNDHKSGPQVNEPSYAHPYFWAPFYLVGNTGTL
jgi:CHAT domain-containing protein/tetratricopeptide (TPR) repeat protein